MLRIDSNVEETHAQVELGHTELLKYFKVHTSLLLKLGIRVEQKFLTSTTHKSLIDYFI